MIKKKTSKKKKSGEVFEVRVTMIVHKSYYVEAKDGEEAIQKLTDSGIVSPNSEEDRDENYEEEYNICGVGVDREPDIK